MKVISSLFGAGQMMFTKYLVVVSGDIDIRNYEEILKHVFINIDLSKDILFSRGPLDVLDHSSENFSFGGKLGIDATIKHIEEGKAENINLTVNDSVVNTVSDNFIDNNIIKRYNLNLYKNGIPVLIVTVDRSEDSDVIDKVINLFRKKGIGDFFHLVLVVDHTVDAEDLYMVTWQILGNSDPQRDHKYISPFSILIDGTIKAYRKGGFSRKWPNVVCSNPETISVIDKKWESFEIGPLITSPSLKYLKLCRKGRDEIIIT
jgi:4-hydroxy-3-polyprenylbenzoate decarboxylase